MSASCVYIEEADVVGLCLGTITGSIEKIDALELKFSSTMEKSSDAESEDVGESVESVSMNVGSDGIGVNGFVNGAWSL